MKPHASYRRFDGAPPQPLWDDGENKRRAGLDQANTQFRERLDRYFRKWEWKHGFRPGAGAILVPAGYVPKAKSA